MELKECIEVSRTSSGSSTTMTKYRSFPIPPRYGHSPTHYPFHFPGMQRLASSNAPSEYSEEDDFLNTQTITNLERTKDNSIYTLLQCIDNLVGVSFFMCPYATKLIGSQFGVLAIGIVALIFSYTASLLEKCQRTLALESYPEVLTYNKSPKSQSIIACIVYAHALLNLFSYYLLIRSSMLSSSLSLLENDSQGKQDAVDGVFIILIVGISLFVLYIGDDWSYKIFRFTDKVKVIVKFILCSLSMSLMIFTAITRLLTIVIADTNKNIDSEGRSNVSLKNHSVSETLQGVCIFCYGYLGHKMLPTIFSSTKDSTNFNQVIFLAFIIVTCLYIAVILLSNGLYRDDVKIIFLWSILPQYTWIHAFFMINISIFLTIKFLLELNCLQGSIVEALDLKKALNIGRGRSNSLDRDHKIVENREIALSTVLHIVIPSSIVYVARKLSASVSFTNNGDSVMIGYIAFVNGGLFGVVLCWLLPISAYIEIDSFGEYIPRHEYVVLYLLMTLGICLVTAVVSCCVLDFVSFIGFIID